MPSSISIIEFSNLNISLDVSALIYYELSMVGISLLMSTAAILYQQSVDKIPIYASVLSVYA